MYGVRIVSLVSVLLLALLFGSAQCVSFEQDLTITPQQKAAVDRLRSRVLPYIKEGYMKEDIYLVRWLRAANFDMRRAEKMFMENLRWRRENKIEGILEEDFTDVKEDYPFTTWGRDKEGRPVFTALAGEWDIRAAVVTGRVHRLLRYLDQVLEKLSREIRQLQREGQHVTQAILIIDLGQFSVVTHGCVQCLLRIVDFINSYETHYPGLADKVFFTNAPPAVALALEVIRQNASKETREALKVYGTNREQWQKVLLKYIDKSNLPVELGGTWERN